MSKPALGRGLGALLSGGKPSATPAPSVNTASPTPEKAPGAVSAGGARLVPWSKIRPSPLQPRKDFTEEALRELADSIREQGIVQPLIVRPVGDHFELIAGERRWRASQLAGLAELPIIERQASDREVLELALIENLQRENLNPIEEANGYAQLQQAFTLTQEQIAQRVGRSRVVVANALRLLRLPEGVQAAVRENRLSVGHAKVLLALADPVAVQRAADKVLKDGLTVRQTEALLVSGAATGNTKAAPSAPPATIDPHVADVENRLRERFATKVGLRYKAGKGSIELTYSSDDELNRLLDLLGIDVD
ncbi:MAG TPA: ParB/RepB/Spo0J family partition protein [Candidatus Limnocylindria bacterium]|nr:ParB/RepB/Spo0J family partition protein [Candidatus Limnocylindria bacterium]